MGFERKILNELIDKYERSNASKFDNAKFKAIRLEIKDKLFEGKRNGSIELDEAISRIENLSFCKITYSDNEFSKIELIVNETNISSIYNYLNRSNPADRKKDLLNFLSSINSNENIIVNNLKNDFLCKINEGKFILLESYYGSLEDLKDIIKAIDEILLLEQDIPERIFSVKVFSDSKRFAALRNRIAKIILDYGDEPFDDEEDVIAAYGVVKNLTHAFVKGNVIIEINGQIIDLSIYKYELALNDSMIESMKVLDVKANKIITVENLTSFYQENSNDSVIIYLGGFHNKVRRNLITKLFDAKPTIKALHYGDIDAGGFYIFNHLKNKTGISFKPYMMGIEQLKQFQEYCKPLTVNDKKRLLKMEDNPEFIEFKAIIQYMLTKNIKLEQEAEN